MLSRIEEVRDEGCLFFLGVQGYTSMHPCMHGGTYACMCRRIDESGGEAAELPAVWGSSSRRAYDR